MKFFAVLFMIGALYSFMMKKNITDAGHGRNQMATGLADTSGIASTTVISGLEVPWELLWGPDNFIWYSEQNGHISKVNPETGENKLLLKLPDLYRKNLGLLSMVVHPDFTSHPYLYINYLYLKPDSVIRSKVVRYTCSSDTLTDPMLLIDMPAKAGHNGARLAISADRKLMIATGDTDHNNDDKNGGNAQNQETPGGKVLRINLDGTVPDDNPFPGNPVWALGFRVPQGLVFGSNGMLYTAEHGNDNDDEINLIKKGGNYGYPYVLGACDQPSEKAFCESHSVIPPIKAWTPTIAPSGIDYYKNGPIAEWKNSILVATLKGQSLRVLKLNAAGTAVVSETVYFEKVFGRLRDICVSPKGDVFISTSNRDWNPPAGYPHEIDDRIIRLRRGVSHGQPVGKVVAAPKKPASPGAVVYAGYCSSCHKDGGIGLEGTFPALKNSRVVFGNKQALIRKVMLGIAAPGQSDVKYEQKMSAFRFLTDQQIAGALTYIRTQFGAKASAVTVGEVAKVRAEAK